MALPVKRASLAEMVARGAGDLSSSPTTTVFYAGANPKTSPRFRRTTKAILKRANKIEARPYSDLLTISDKSVTKNGDITSDMRNYISYARFYWPQPQVPAACKMFNGTLVTPNDKPKNVDRDLPFIRLSGCVNSRRTGRSSDKKKLKRVSLQLYILALAYKITGKLKYEVQATNIMKKFFTSSKYGMLPRFNFASWVVRSARNRYRGQGVREARHLLKVVDALYILKGAMQANHKGTFKKMTRWFATLARWMHESPNGVAARRMPNSHGTWWIAQYATYYTIGVEHGASLSGFKTPQQLFDRYAALSPKSQRCTAAAVQESKDCAVAKECRASAILQFSRSGESVVEACRAESLHFQIDNLRAAFAVAHLADRYNVNVFAYRHPGGREPALRMALDFILVNAEKKSQKRYKAGSSFRDVMSELDYPLRMANYKYGDTGKYDYDTLADGFCLSATNPSTDPILLGRLVAQPSM